MSKLDDLSNDDLVHRILLFVVKRCESQPEEVKVKDLAEMVAAVADFKKAGSSNDDEMKQFLEALHKAEET